MSFNMKKFLRLKKIEEAKEKRAAAKKAAAAAATPSAGTAQPIRYANGARSTTAKDAADRIENKKMVTRRVRMMIANHPNDLLGMKWKVRHECRWNDELQRDTADSLSMLLAGLAEEWQREFDEYDAQHARAEPQILDMFKK